MAVKTLLRIFRKMIIILRQHCQPLDGLRPGQCLARDFAAVPPTVQLEWSASKIECPFRAFGLKSNAKLQ